VAQLHDDDDDDDDDDNDDDDDDDDDTSQITTMQKSVYRHPTPGSMDSSLWFATLVTLISRPQPPRFSSMWKHEEFRVSSRSRLVL